MIKYAYTRLMYPEPEDSGTPTPPTEPANDSNPFDFRNMKEKEGGEETSKEEPNEESEDKAPEEYALAFTPEDGLSEEDAAFLTDKAKELNLPADSATEFVRALGKMLTERDEAKHTRMEKELQREWGKNYDATLKKTGAFMNRQLSALNLSQEEIMEFMTPLHFRVFNHIMKSSSEKQAVGAPAVLTAEQRSARLAELARQRVQYKYSNNNEAARAVTDEINRICGHAIYVD